MTAKSAVDEIRLSRVLLLLALSVFINYLDRGNLSIAAPLLKNEFQLSATQLGILLSSFFWTYSFFLPVSGWLVDRLDVKWVIASGFFLWSAATAATGAVHAFGTLLLARLALGAGESVSYPACSTILSRYFPEHKRGFANASIVAGMALGPAFGTLSGGILMSRLGGARFFSWWAWLACYGYRHGFAGCQKAIPIPCRIQDSPRPTSADSEAAVILGNMCRSILYELLAVLSPNLATVLPPARTSFFPGRDGEDRWVGLFSNCCLSASAGWISDRCIAPGKTPTLVRKTFMVVGQVGLGFRLQPASSAGHCCR